MKLIAATTIFLSVSTVSGFVSPTKSVNAFTSRNANSINVNKNINTNLNLSPSDIPLESIDATTTAAAIQHLLDSSSAILSDAAGAAADDGGWWQSYLNVYKSLLIGVHSVIDEPLRNSGWDQTWGVSIAIFTASEYYRFHVFP